MKTKSLRYKINAAIFITCTAVAVIFAAILYPIIVSSHNTQLRNISFMLDAVFQQKKENLANEVFAGYEIALEVSLEDLLKVEGISAAAVWDKNGDFLASAGDPVLTEELAEPLSEQALKMSPFSPVFEKQTLSKRSMAVYSTAISYLGKHLGYVKICYELAELDREFRLSIEIFVILLITMLLLMFVLLNFLLSRMVTRPVSLLRQAIHKIQAGSLGGRVRLESQDEIGNMAASFNEMSIDLYEKEKARQKAEKKHKAHIYFLESLERIDQALQRADDMENMMREVAETVFSIFECDRAWFLYPCDPEARLFHVPVEVSRPEYPGVFELNRELPMNPVTSEVCAAVLASSDPVTFGPGAESPSGMFAEKFGVLSQMSAAVRAKRGKPWMFGIHQCSHVRKWRIEEKRLFREIGRRIGDSLTAFLVLRDLKESENRYRILFEDSPISLWEEDFSAVKSYFEDLRRSGTDLDKHFMDDPEAIARCAGLVRILDVNNASLDLFGVGSKNELISSLPAIFTKEAMETFREEIITLAGGGVQFESETALRTPSGREIFAVLRVSVAPGHEDSLGKVLVSLVDITDRKRTEEELKQHRDHLEVLVRERTGELVAANRMLRESEERYVQLLKFSADAIVLYDSEGRVEYLNPAFTNLFGWTYEELKGKKIPFVPDEAVGETADVIGRMLSGEIILGFNTKRLTKDRGKIDASLSAAPIIDDAGTVSGIVVILRDETKRRKMEIALKQAKETAEAANLAKSEFLANMSHEIRTPMNGVIGMTELLMGTDLDNRQRDYAGSIRNSANALLTILDDILDLSKIQAGKLRIEAVPFDLRELVEQIGQLTAGRAGAKGLETLVRYPPEIPDHFEGDPTRIRQIVNNLMGNAVKFTEQGHVFLKVECESRTEDLCNMVVSVADTGIGIPDEMKEAVFDKFSQGDVSTTRKFGGTGLGLTISKQLVEMMGGTIGLKSEYGRGSEFFIRLELPCCGRMNGDRETGESLSGVPVLVADAGEMNREIALEYLRSWDIPCEGAGSADEAMSRLKQAKRDGKPFGIAVLDCSTVETEGLADTIKTDSLTRDTILVLLSSNACPGELDKKKRTHFAASLPKPIRASLFFQTLLESWKTFGNGVSRPVPEKSGETGDTDAAGIDADILLVEDNDVNQKVAAGIVQRYGCRVDIAENGKEALERFKRKDYDLVFMDAHMPVMDGFEASEKIREYENGTSHVPIIAMTALAMEGDRERCLAAGMDDYIPKPINSEVILDALLKYCTGRAKEEKSVPEVGENAGTPVMNVDQVLNIGDYDREMICELIDEFEKTVPVLLDELLGMLSSGDRELIGRKVHKLNGLVANFGGERAVRTGLEIEEACRKESFNPNTLDFEKLGIETTRLRKALAETDWKSLCDGGQS